MSRRAGVTVDRGNAVIEVTWLGILLLLPLLWIVLAVFQVQKGAFAVSAASRAAGRAYALAPDGITGEARARAAAQGALSDAHVESGVEVTVSCTPYPGDCHAPASIITVHVHSRVELPWLPLVLGGGAPTFALDAANTVPIGRFRE